MVNTNSLTEEMKKELAFTEEELKELEIARKMPIIFDEDCPDLRYLFPFRNIFYYLSGIIQRINTSGRLPDPNEKAATPDCPS